MTTFQIKRADGSEYDVDADSREEASRKLYARLQDEINTKGRAEMESAPMWQRPFRMMEDMARVGTDAASFGLADKLAGGEHPALTAAARDRMGWAALPLEAGAGVATPTGVPGLVAKVGGGPIVRGITRAFGGAAEGGVAGGIQAATGDQGPVSEGVGQGMLAGVLGQAGAAAVAKPTNMLAKWWQGVSDTLPPPSMKNLPGKGMSPAKRVEDAAYKGQEEGGSQKDIRDAFEKMRVTKSFKPDALEGIGAITKGDPGTNISGKLGSMVAGMNTAGQIGAGMTTQDWKAMVAMMATVPAISGALKYASKQGTTESVENLRRLMLKSPKFQGPISPEIQDKLRRGGTRGLLDILTETED